MKTTKVSTLQKRIFVGILALFMILPFMSFAKKIPFLLSTITPAARGYVKIKKDRNRNFVIKIHISDLAEIGRIIPTKQTYVVWIVTDRDLKKNVGRVKSSRNFSNNLTVYFETVSSYKPTQVFITAEGDESVQTPGDVIVLTTDRF
jgi:hypothetical protein